MNGSFTRKPDPIGPMHVVFICLVACTVGAGTLLLSAPESTTLVDGAVEWQVQSPLRAVVQLLCLNYQFPTIHAGTVKNFILGIGAGLAILTLALAVVARRLGGEDATISEEPTGFQATGIDSPDSAERRKVHVAPFVASQILVGLFLLWSFASSRWSAAADLALGGSTLLAIQFLWSMGIGNGLNRSAALIASRSLIVVVAIASGVALWYYYGRNPTLRAKFPFGNPTFLAASLIPGIALSVALIAEIVFGGDKRRKTVSVALALIAFAVVFLALWTFRLADSRGALVGLVFALLAMMFFALRGRARVVPIFLALGVLVYAAWSFPIPSADSISHGRSVTLRLRVHSWGYAWHMFNEKPLTGHGQGGFVLAGDAHAVKDVLNDPLPFEARIAHVHNEWLEVLADLGSVGFALIVAALGLTLWAGMIALSGSPPSGERWALIGLMGSLVGLTVEEAFGVGLRVSGVPTWFFTVIGLIWALASRRPDALTNYLAKKSARRGVAGVIGIGIAVAVLAITQQDFAAARAAYGARTALQTEDYEKAIDLATAAATGRLNPQRTLEDLARLSEAQMLVASELQQRAVDRETRAGQSDLPDPQLLALAQQDRLYSDHHCKEGNRALKELVARSPGYFNHGRIEYELNLIQAGNAAARNDQEERDQRIRNAAAASDRELRRRPFDPSITLEYLSVADNVDLVQRVNILARPLRHNRLDARYVDALAHLITSPDFEAVFQKVVEGAYDTVTASPAGMASAESIEPWAPEKLRLAATVQFRRGNYHAASEALRIASRAYDALAASAPMGAASCYAELADCQFFAEPERADIPIQSAQHAISLAPESLQGRRLKRNVRHRMVDYYLAADDEDQAMRTLMQMAPPTVGDEVLRSALGMRYRAMCEALRDRRLAQVLRQPVDKLLPKLQRWAARAIELNGDDYQARYLAADLAFYAGDCDATAAHLLQAIQRGLPLESAERFLQAARSNRPDCTALEEVGTTLNAAQHIHAPTREPVPQVPAEPRPSEP